MPRIPLPSVARGSTADDGFRHTAFLLAVYAGMVIVGGLLAVAFMGFIQWAGMAHQPLESVVPSIGLPFR
jgi:hypothetical protein